MKQIILNPLIPVAKQKKSHVRGWAMAWQERLVNCDIGYSDDNLKPYTNIFLDNGVNYNGQLNLFDGLNDKVILRLMNIYEAWKDGTKVFSLDVDMKDAKYIDQFENRMARNNASELLDIDLLLGLDDMYKDVKPFYMYMLGLTDAIVGDSHCTAFALPHQAIERTNGALLYTAMKQGMTEYLRPFAGTYPSSLTVCLGSIDMRFHVIRDGGWSAIQFADNYAKQIIEAQDELGVPISVCAPVPVEYEGRKIPKTLQYNNQNFVGSREERHGYTMTFIERLNDYWDDFQLIKPPIEWYTMDGEQYAKEMMETPRSVHISPTHYRTTLKWGT